jgi:hypothetical protein
MDEQVDLRNTRPRLIRFGIACLIGAVLTFFTIKAMLSAGGHGPNKDPIGASLVWLLAIGIFVVTTMFALKIISKKR